MTAARFPSGVEVRTAAEMRVAAGRKLEGWAAVFDQPTRIANFSEVVRRTAFDASLASDADVICNIDHDNGKLLGRRRNGTLRLAVDAKGLFFSVDVPQTSLGVDIIALAERGDLGGASFAFRIKKEDWPTRDKRELLEVELLDVAICQAFPSYAGTEVIARSQRLAAPPNAAAVLRRRLVLGTV